MSEMSFDPSNPFKEAVKAQKKSARKAPSDLMSHTSIEVSGIRKGKKKAKVLTPSEEARLISASGLISPKPTPLRLPPPPSVQSLDTEGLTDLGSLDVHMSLLSADKTGSSSYMHTFNKPKGSPSLLDKMIAAATAQ